MRTLLAAALIVLGTVLAVRTDASAVERVDLRDARALEVLRETNPVHYAKIQQIITELLEQPRRVEQRWLETTFDARDVELNRLAVQTSYPPKQLLMFTLDDTRYAMYLVRTDLVPRTLPASVDE